MAVFNTTTLGINLYYAFIQNPATIAAGATITNVTASYNGDAVYGGNGYAWSVYNYGTIEGTQTGSSGIHLTEGGDVHNGSIALTTTRIAGDAFGVKILGGAGTVGNYGTISATGATGIGVFLGQGGLVNNGIGASSALISGFRGVDIQGYAGTVFNDGTIAGSGVNSYGVRLYDGGDLTNGSAGLIVGERAVVIGGSGGTLTNYGTIVGDSTEGGVGLAGGVVLNGYLGGTGGLIAGRYGVRSIPGVAVTNYGTIAGSGISGYYSSGVFVGGGSTVVNGDPTQTALITGYDGVRITGTGTVTNFGTISGVAAGVSMGNAGLVINHSAGTIIGEDGIVAGVGIGTVVNAGTIVAAGGGPSSGIEFASSGTVINSGLVHTTGGNAVQIGNGAGTIENSGTIVSYYGGGFSGFGVLLNAGGQVTNQIGALIYSYGDGVGSAGGGTVINHGTISGDTGVSIGGGPALVLNNGTLAGRTGSSGHSDVVAIYLGGTVVNSALISAPDGHGVYIYGSGGTVNNYGTIVGGGAYYGVYLTSGGFVTNQPGASIAAYVTAIKIDGGVGVVVNAGTVSSDNGGGIYLLAGGNVTNEASGRIDAVVDGIFINGGSGTVTNLGTIETTLSGGGGVGVFLVGGGFVNNQASGAILTASGLAVSIGAGGTLANYGTITNSYGDAVSLQAGGRVGNYDGLISGTSTGIEVGGALGRILNDGTIAGDTGVSLAAGGTVTNIGLIAATTYAVVAAGVVLVHNPGTIAAPTGQGVSIYGAATLLNSGHIAAYDAAFYAASSPATVVNNGTIESINAEGVLLRSGGTVNNYGALIVGATTGVYIGGGGGTVFNSGTISTSDSGVYLAAGGTVTNQSGLIAGPNAGVRIGNGLGLVSNTGTIAGGGVYLAAGGTVTNGPSARIEGADRGVVIVNGLGVVTNYGTIGAADNYTAVIALQSGGSVDNQQAGLIDGAGTGIFLDGSAGTASNLGTIIGTVGSGIALDAGGLVENGAIGISTAAISGGYAGIKGLNASTTVVNYGTISGYNIAGIFLYAGGTVTNAAGALVTSANRGVDIRPVTGTLDNSGVVHGDVLAVYLGGDGIVNNQLGGVIQGGSGVGIEGQGTVANFGTIIGTGAAGFGANLAQGGSVYNGASGTITGPLYGNAVRIDGGTGTLTNFGLIQSAAAGDEAVYFSAGGTVTNTGLISGANDVVLIRVNGLVTNTGTITAAGEAAVWLADGGRVVNHGLLLATNDAVFTGGAAGTVVNYGTIIDTGIYGDGVCLEAGGTVVNSGTIIGPNFGIEAHYGLGNVDNSGTIGSGGIGIYMSAGGIVTNAVTGLVTGASTGIAISDVTAAGATGTVFNSGTIAGTGLYGTGLRLVSGGSLINAQAGLVQGLIQGHYAVVVGSNAGGVGTVVNDGSIAGGSVGVWLQAGGTVVNSAAITATTGNGVVIGSYGGAGYILNYGTILAPNIAAFLQAGGSVSNNGTIASTGPTGFGVEIQDGVGIVTNNGAISGYRAAIWLQDGGIVFNYGSIVNPGAYGYGILISNYGGAGYVRNEALIRGPSVGILASAPTGVVNYGTIVGTDVSSGEGVVLNTNVGTVVNYGTILGAGRRGVYLGAGGAVTNRLNGTITGGSGVGIVNGAGTIGNLGTIEGTAYPGVGVFLGSGGSVTNGDGATTTALISGANNGIVVYGAPAAVVNYGTIVASIGFASAVKLVAGGAVDNKSSGLMQGGGLGVLIYGAAGTVTNDGAIVGTSSAGVRLGAGGTIANGLTTAASITGADGVVLLNGGTVFNGSGSSTAAVIDGSGYGIFAVAGAATIGNYATITGVNAGVVLDGGGFVLNADGAVIASADTGVEINNAAGTLSNAGTVQGGDLGAYLAGGGSVFNGQAGAIVGGDGIRIIGGVGTVTNYGAVSGTTTSSGYAVQLSQGGSVLNGAATAASASILGTLRGVSISTGAGSVTNFGTIAASITFATAVYLQAGGSLTNQQSGLIRGGGDGVVISGAAGTVTNLGSIDGLTDTGVVLTSGGLIVNGYGGGEGGPIYDATISGGFAGVELQNVAATIVNFGTIVDPGYAGVVARAGGNISNYRLITGEQYGVMLTGGPGTITNSGEVSATAAGGTGVSLAAGGAIANTGTIAGGRNGVVFDAATSIGNQGLINGAGLAGVYGSAGVGVITNFGTISGGLYGARLAAGSTLFNAGTVGGGSRAVYFIGGNNRLAIDPAAVFIGYVDAHLGTGDVLELAPGFGTLSGFGTSFFGFEAIVVDVFADWQVAGALTFDAGFVVTDAGALDFDNDLINNGTLAIELNAVLSFTGTVGGTGVIDFNGPNGILVFGVPSVVTNSIVDFAPTNAILFVGIGLAASYSYSGGVLRLNNSGGTQVAQVNLTTPVTNPHFTLSSGPGSSTLLAVNEVTGTFTGTYFNGVVLSNPAAQNPALATSTAFITNNYGAYGGDAVYGTSAAAWTLTNYGTITTNPTATGAAGVQFQAGGTVSNAAIISGGVNGVVINGGAGLVANSGVIAATNTGTGAGIALLAGGNVSNAAGGTISGFDNGVFISGGIGGVANAGTILSTGVPGGAAVYLAGGGGVTNLAGGLITAYRNAISIKGGAGALTNFGTIQNAGTQSAAIYLGGGGAVTNAAGGVIFSPHRNALVISGSASAVTNAGTILSTATFAQVGTVQTGRYGALVLNAGGIVSNTAGALIAGHTGVDFNNLVGTVFNAGTISQNDPIRYGAGVLLYGGGLVRNGPNSTALITAYNTGVHVGPSSQGLGAGGPGTVVNYGTIAHIGSGTSGSAIYLGGGGIVVNYGLISGARGGSDSTGYPGAIQVRNQTGVIINLGTVTNPNNSNGINLLSGGILVNGAAEFNSALIDAPHTAVYIGGTLGTVINYGTIQNTTTAANAMTMTAGGTVINYGLVSSARTGVAFTNTTGTIVNFGTIVSTLPLSGTRGAGVYLAAGGSVTNQAGASITAYRAAVSLAFLGTTSADSVITNFGVLSGATGISIGAGDIGDNTIINYGTITGTNGIAIVLGGGDDDIVLASSSRLYGAVGNFQIGDTFGLPFLAFSSAETVSLDPGNLLSISQSGVLVYTIQLDPSQDFGTNEFRLTNDGLGGTLVVLGPDTTAPATLTRVLAVNANSGPTPIGIAAPTDPADPPELLTISVTGLPTDGTVVLSDGVTPVSIGQVLTVAQLTTLQFIATPNVEGQSSTFTYSVSDPAGNTGLGTAFLGINLPPPPNSPALINGLGGVEDFGENVLPPNDDGSSSAIDITAVFGGGLDFFGTTYTSLFLNNNGNITFTGPLSTFTPEEITAGFGNPIIAAFWADVDTRGGPGVPTGGNATGSNTVYWDLDPVNQVFTATWNDVGYFSTHNDKLDAFQLRLIGRGDGDFDIEFRYQAVYWTTGDFSGGSGGLGGIPARAGFSAGDDVNFYELPQSGDQDAMLGIESNPAPPGTLGVTSEIGVYRFQVRDGGFEIPVPTGLTLSPASDSGQAGDNRTNVIAPTITGAGGIVGNTITLFADGTVVGTSAVSEDGTWSVTASQLLDGGYNLTATQTRGSAVSLASAPLFVTIDTSAPTTVPVSRTVLPNTAAAEIGIPLPTDPDDDFSDPDQAPTIVVSTLPINGAVTLDGVTPVSLGQQLTISQLIGLDFAPTGQIGSTDSFTYTVTDLAGNTSSGIATFTIATSPPPPPPPAPTGLALSPASDSGRAGDNRTNDTTPTIIGDGGISGSTITLFANGTVVGSGTAFTDGTWSVTATLFPIRFSDGDYNLTVTQFSGDAVSPASAPLFVTIDTSAPTTVPVSRTVQPNAAAAEIGIALPTDPDDDFSDPDQAPMIVVITLPGNGTVTLDGVTPVGLGQQLSTSQLIGLDFTPTGQLGSTGSFTYTVTDLAGNTSGGSATFTIAAAPTVQLFDFVFVYNDGSDYYTGKVSDSGNFGYRVGQTISTGAGRYEILGVESTLSTLPSGTVSVGVYSHNGVGQASPTPFKLGEAELSGTGGLGSESDAILGLDGELHGFSPTVEASFRTTPLWGFVYSYADGRAFYTGTVASDTPLGNRSVTDAAGNIIGSYSVFLQGVTTRTNGTVVVDRFTLNGVSFAPLSTGLNSINGQGGLGTEQGLITVNGATVAFGSLIEPSVTVSQPTLPLIPPPDPNDVAAAQVTSFYLDILGREPDPVGLAIYTDALANGTSITAIRTIFAQSSEAQTALNQLYRQIFGRDIAPTDANLHTASLINGSSLASVQIILAQSAEAQSAIQRIYQQVLDRPVDGAGLTTQIAALGNPQAPLGLSEIRDGLAHSGEAAADLSQLVLDTLRRPTFAAELVGMEDEISTDGVTQQTLQAELFSTNTAGTYSRVFDAPGNTLLTAHPGVPTLFVFSEIATDTIVGFDPGRDTIQLPTGVAADFAAVQSRMTNAPLGGTLIQFSSSQGIAVGGVAPGSLGTANFRFV